MYDRPGLINRIAGFAAIILSFTAVIMLIALGAGSESNGYLGGLNWIDYIFNWHPIFMVFGLIFCSITAILSYRLIPMSKARTKIMHGIFHTGAVICLSLGLYAVAVGNDYRNRNTDDAIYPNLFSLHSFLGLAALILYSFNYIMGIGNYLMPVSVTPLSVRRRYMPTHVFIGSFAFFAAVFAALCGLQELFTEYDCAPNVTQEDSNTSKEYLTLSDGCRLMNCTGLVLFAAAFCAALAFWENHAHLSRQQSMNSEFKDDLLSNDYSARGTGNNNGSSVRSSEIGLASRDP